MEFLAPHDEPVIVFRRAFNAPARLVFAAWTEPQHLRHWRGPRGFELVACEVDLRVGGAYLFVHRAPDGSRHVFYGQYLEIERPSRLVSTFAYEAAPGFPLFIHLSGGKGSNSPTLKRVGTAISTQRHIRFPIARSTLDLRRIALCRLGRRSNGILYLAFSTVSAYSANAPATARGLSIHGK